MVTLQKHFPEIYLATRWDVALIRRDKHRKLSNAGVAWPKLWTRALGHFLRLGFRRASGELPTKRSRIHEKPSEAFFRGVLADPKPPTEGASTQKIYDYHIFSFLDKTFQIQSLDLLLTKSDHHLKSSSVGSCRKCVGSLSEVKLKRYIHIFSLFTSFC